MPVDATTCIVRGYRLEAYHLSGSFDGRTLASYEAGEKGRKAAVDDMMAHCQDTEWSDYRFVVWQCFEAPIAGSPRLDVQAGEV